MARPRKTSRITPKGTRPQGSQIAPTSAPRHGSQSASWFGWLILTLLSIGTAVIVSNYMSWLPGSPTSAWIAVGLAIVLASILLATRWR
ncbi:cell division protein CrgA [Candidatus Poriferisodalis sp.]|uniref:cell division protein CrgA n=1 Tax=Candidatus Poriferisodalis sp. TaxID=3101277 RepID=UPI003B012DDC